MGKKVRIGSLLVEKKTNLNGKEYTSVYLGLGTMGNKDPKYNTSVELVVKDNNGNVIHTQKNGFISLTDPRTQPDELLAAGVIKQETYDKMKEGLTRLPEKIKYSLEVSGR